MSLQNKIDFAVILEVQNANPNGDPLNGNRPRVDYDGFGEITDVCLKRKIRDRLQEIGENVFVQSDEKKNDGMTSLQNRAYSDEVGLGKDAFDAKKTDVGDTIAKSCEKWIDVRSFGQIFAFSAKKSGDGVSIPIRGPVSIQCAISLKPVGVTSTQITKSVSGEGDGGKKSSDTMGMKHRVDKGVYVTYGAITPQLAERTGFSDADAEILKQVLPKLFEGDASSARPEGSMAVIKIVWWRHNSKSGQYSSAKVHQSLRNILNSEDGSFDDARLANTFPDLCPEVINGF